jgi:hypothetical protein
MGLKGFIGPFMREEEIQSIGKIIVAGFLPYTVSGSNVLMPRRFGRGRRA